MFCWPFDPKHECLRSHKRLLHYRTKYWSYKDSFRGDVAEFRAVCLWHTPHSGKNVTLYHKCIRSDGMNILRSDTRKTVPVTDTR